ncbi:SMP-30/gluconolactonase/LRE family protein [Rhizobium sp. SSA_523]|uniref:SMP-30/gluconolactonase/LRE family protein n=1 Tax=Rhizobium sp. SSA_523 TaxID=2952477 RepID=UPI0020909000|nr:SMP-30/gluconolactonase/LRE family protein [Rhizobium sp. SSA_523]MCO5731149.1 SMP-30/gluconolactonase/LRE family protein [Rhizobium sp. SSA_523]WKC22305.1 SMP-30/gluconolactonase/LRE family protein [Rhizobium sp. SSA_523]
MPQTTIIHPKTRTVLDRPLHVGESPCWDDRSGDLWLVDILAPAVLCIHAGGSVSHFPMPALIGCLALCESGRIAVGLQTGVHLMDPETGRLERLCDPDGGRADSRLNDGKVGPDGHFWVGTRDEAVPQTGNARLYRVAPDGSFDQVLDGLNTSNGLAWSADGKTMFHSDSSQQFLQSFAFDPQTGALGPARRLFDFTNAEGRPDGAATDMQGFYWSAGVLDGKLNRMSPEGEIVELYQLPVSGPTMPCFGGPELKTVYVTSLKRKEGVIDEMGTVIAFEVDVPGVPVHRFPV